MVQTLIKILTENTALVENTDLFYLEIPLGKTGVWFSNRPVPSTFNGTDYREFDIYYRGKTKQSLITNTEYLKTTLDELHTEICELSDGTTFSLKVLSQWESLGKDSEGYYVFATSARLFV